MTLESLESVCARFREFDLHDSSVINFTIRRRSNIELPIDDLLLEVELIDNWQVGRKGGHAELVFLDCTYIELGFDLAAKHEVADCIHEAICALDSPLRQRLEAGPMRHEIHALEEYVHFTVKLVPYAGELNVFARDFTLTFL